MGVHERERHKVKEIKYVLKDMRDAYNIEHAPMTNTESETFIKATFLDMQVKEPFNAEDVARMEYGLATILFRRTQYVHDVTLSKGLAIFTLAISDRPGTIVLWAYTYHQMYRELGRMVTIDDFANVFPMGIPTEKAMEQIWEDQKAYTRGEKSNRNLIDDKVNW